MLQSWHFSWHPYCLALDLFGCQSKRFYCQLYPLLPFLKLLPPYWAEEGRMLRQPLCLPLPRWEEELVPLNPKNARWAAKAERGCVGVNSNGAAMGLNGRELRCKNSWVDRWLWSLEYDRRSAFVDKPVTRSRKSLWRPRKTYKLKSMREMGRPAATSSSKNPLAFCKYVVTESSPWRRSWRQPCNCMIQEFDGDTRACSSLLHTLIDVRQSTTRWSTYIDREERRVLRMSWSCCFHAKKAWEKPIGCFNGRNIIVRRRTYCRAINKEEDTLTNQIWLHLHAPKR